MVKVSLNKQTLEPDHSMSFILIISCLANRNPNLNTL